MKDIDRGYKQKWAEELVSYKDSEKLSVIVGVEISKGKPWPPALKIVELHNKGFDVKAIAKEVGYSTQTVERNIKTKGVDPRIGSQCVKYAGRVFSIDEALALMPLPCSETCVCYWRTVLRSD
ncbi:MAG: hypothetical protein COA54_02390 [Thiotrichaceae bacterium]|nr:MAG: hypothetical protein COA54_02390 [Thiotrichaceae bacterium]